MERLEIIEKQRYGDLMELGMCPDGHIRIIDKLGNSREKVNNELIKTYYETTHEFTQDTQSMLQVIWDRCKMYEEQRKTTIEKQFHEFFADNAPHPISMEALYLICNYFYFFPKRISKERPTLSVPYRLYQIMNSNLPTTKLQLEQPFEGGYVYCVGGWNSFTEYEKTRNSNKTITTMETKSNNNAGGNWEYVDLKPGNGCRTFLAANMIRVHNKKNNHTMAINSELSNLLREKETLCLRVRIDRDLGTIQFVFNKTTGRRPRLDRAHSQSLSYASSELVSLIMGNKKSEMEDFPIRKVGITDEVVIYELIK
jgi:hypothetical protein